jgi:hypothetical protein
VNFGARRAAGLIKNVEIAIIVEIGVPVPSSIGAENQGRLT